MSNIVLSKDEFELSLFNPLFVERLNDLAVKFSSSDMVPNFYKAGAVIQKGNKNQPEILNSPEKAAANTFIALSMAHRLGADPLMVMQNMKPINGEPSLSSKFIIALINNAGKWDQLEFEIVDLGDLVDPTYEEVEWNGQTKVPVTKTIKGTIKNWGCRAHTRKKGDPKEIWGPQVTILMMIQEGVYQRNGSKWRTMWELMITYRSATQWASVHAPEITIGIPSTEEVQERSPVEEGDAEVLSSKIQAAASASPKGKTVSIDPKPKTEPASVEEPKTAEPVKEEVKTEPVKEDPKPATPTPTPVSGEGIEMPEEDFPQLED